MTRENSYGLDADAERRFRSAGPIAQSPSDPESQL
jgi:hypothetical protein